MFPVNGLMDNAEVDIVLIFIASLKNFLKFFREKLNSDISFCK